MTRRSRLSDLPQDLISEKILSHLKIHEAARTSVLCRSWRNLWKSTPNLDFYSYFDLPSPDHYHRPIIEVLRSRYHSPDPIRILKLSVGYKDAPFVHQILSSSLPPHASSTLQTLALDFKHLRTFFSDPYYDTNSIALGFPNLVHLHLCFCRPIGTHFSTFPSLRTLTLVDLRANDEVLTNLISACPLLEDLCLRSVRMSGSVSFSAPRLRRLRLSGDVGVVFSVVLAPLLEDANLHFSFRTLFNIVQHFFGATPSIKKLQLSSSILEKLGVEHGMKTVPLVLQDLGFIRFDMDSDVVEHYFLLGALCILNMSPHLQELHIWNKSHSLQSKGVGEAKYVWESQNNTNISDKLGTVHFRGVTGREAEIDFVLFILAKSRGLKALHICFKKYVKGIESLKNKIMQLPRASDQAQIIFCDCFN